MILLLDIGNTHTHVGLADRRRVRRHVDVPTAEWFGGAAPAAVCEFVGSTPVDGVAACSVVPRALPPVRKFVRSQWGAPFLELGPSTLKGVGIDYPKPATIGPDRLANAVAVFHHYGGPAVVVDFGTAVTFDVVDRRGMYVGGIIAPGLAAMTDYLHEKTALLPRVTIREPRRVIGKSTEEAMLIGAVHGYRGLVRQLVYELREELHEGQLVVVATGGYAQLLASRMPEISAVEPQLTLEGLRLTWHAHQNGSGQRSRRPERNPRASSVRPACPAGTA